MSDQNQNIFNVNNLLAFKDKEREKVLNIGAYNGQITLNVANAKFERGNSDFRSIAIPPMAGYLILQMLKDMVDHPEPEKKKTLVFNGLYDREAKKYVLSLAITIGMDDTGMFYIGVKHVNSKHETFSRRFEIIGDKRIDVAGLYDDDKSRSLVALQMLHHYFDRMYFQQAALFTRNNLRKSNQNSKKDSDSSSSKIDDDTF